MLRTRIQYHTHRERDICIPVSQSCKLENNFSKTPPFPHSVLLSCLCLVCECVRTISLLKCRTLFQRRPLHNGYMLLKYFQESYLIGIIFDRNKTRTIYHIMILTHLKFTTKKQKVKRRKVRQQTDNGHLHGNNGITFYNRKPKFYRTIWNWCHICACVCKICNREREKEKKEDIAFH